MYELRKEAGYGATFTVANVESGSTFTFGGHMPSVLEILKAHDEYHDEAVADAWRLPISKETAEKLYALTTRLHKPIRVKKSSTKVEPTEQKTPETDNKKIDAMDVILGLAKYNR